MNIEAEVPVIWCHVVACGLAGEIGVAGAMPWHIPEDLKFFRKLTTGHTILMGRKTFDSIGKALPNRRNVVLTSNRGWQYEGVLVYHSLEEVRQALTKENAWDKSQQPNRVFIVGGGDIYAQSFPFTSQVYLTRIASHFAEADTHYPVHLLADEKTWERRKIAEGVSPEGVPLEWFCYTRYKTVDR